MLNSMHYIVGEGYSTLQELSVFLELAHSSFSQEWNYNHIIFTLANTHLLKQGDCVTVSL
jgi:hypothetical protein